MENHKGYHFRSLTIIAENQRIIDIIRFRNMMIEVYKYNSHYVIILSINKLNIMAVFNYYKNSPIHEINHELRHPIPALIFLL